MKNVMIVLIFLLCNGQNFAQNSTKDFQYKKLKTFLKKDSLSFQQFLIAKRCFCRENFITIDELRSGKESNNSIKDLYELFRLLKKEGYIFFVAIDVQKLASFFNINLINEYVSSRGRISDNVNIVDNKNILCETISSPTRYNYSQYANFINNLDNYVIPINKGTSFLKEETYLNELFQYYPGKKEKWYNFNTVHKILETE